MPSTDRKLELKAKTSEAQTGSQAKVLKTVCSFIDSFYHVWLFIRNWNLQYFALHFCFLVSISYIS
jgi:hypothetical protein